MWVRYKQNTHTTKSVEVWGKKYDFPRMKWVEVTNRLLSDKVSQHRDVFDICLFDPNVLSNLDDKSYSVHGNIVYTDDHSTVEILQEMSKYFTLKCIQESKDKDVYLFYVNDTRGIKLDSVLSTGGNVGVYRLKGGWGDIIVSYSAAVSLQRNNPNIKVIYSCPTQFEPLIKDGELEFKELNSFVKAGYDAYINLTSPCIRYESRTQPFVDKNRSQIFMDSCHIATDLYSPVQPVNKDALKRAADYIKDLPRPLIGLIPSSCAPIRDWWGWEFVSDMVYTEFNGTNLVVNADPLYQWNTDTALKVFGEDMDFVVALLSLCDCVAGVDTGPMHSAASLGIPTVWVFTHIDGKIRTNCYKDVAVCQSDKTVCDKIPCWYTKACPDSLNAACGEHVSVNDVFININKFLNRRSHELQH